MSEDASIDSLRQELQKLLAAKKPDFGQILELSQRLAGHDEDFVRFSADSGLISRLGEQLVARQETAVSELVKNAYDADATSAKLIFTSAERPGGRLFIRDNGVGMTREQIVKGFMRLASPVKIDEPHSPKYARQRAGRKGIGRFAAQRLGKRLTLVTQTEDSETALKVEIDWGQFERGRDLFHIPSRIVPIKKERSHGTTLIIDGLREAWSDQQIGRAYRYVQDLIQPFPIEEVELRPCQTRHDPGFKAVLCRLVGAKEVEIASEETMLFQYSVADVSGVVDADGKAHWEVVSKRLSLNETGEISSSRTVADVPFQALRDVHVRFSARYFLWLEEFIPGQELTRLRLIAQAQGGIRLYRNGFRVLPYGEPDDDWLELDKAYRKREILPSIGNTNWFGSVQILDPESRSFEETSSREGLLRNEAFSELVNFVSRSLKEAALRIASARGKKGRTGQKGHRKAKQASPDERLRGVADELGGLADELERNAVKRGERPGPEVVVVREVVQRLRLEAGSSEELIQELAMLRVLAGLGVTIGVFTHEVRHRLVDLHTRVRDLLEGTAIGGKTGKTLEVIEAHVKMLRSYAGYFDDAISDNVRRELVEQELGPLLYDFVDELGPVVARDEIVFAEPEIREDQDLRTRPMHPSEWTSILTNLLSNAIKAIRRKRRPEGGKVLLRAWREQQTLFLDFADNGVGIPPANTERIFDAFFTTTAGGVDELSGTGLGLKIVRDIVNAAGGDIYVTNAPKGYSTCLRLEVPAASQEL